MNNIGMYIFSTLVLAGLIALIWMKIRWSRQASRNWAAVTARNATFK